DEAFLDVTHYLKAFGGTPREFAMVIIRDVLEQTGITATAGIGTNMYLAKVAMDIVAKHLPGDENGVRIAELDEMSYRRKLWTHTPLTDFWRVGPGYSKRLHDLGIKTMGDLARYSLTGSDKLYKIFGVNAELLIDHAWGWEPTRMEDVKKYKSANHSLSVGQVLAEPYDFEKAKIIVWEMADALSLELVQKGLMTDQMVLAVGYDVASLDTQVEAEIDFYGRKVPKSAHGSINLSDFTNSGKIITKKVLELFAMKVDRSLLFRRFSVAANHVRLENEVLARPKQLDLFTNYVDLQKAQEREKHLQEAELKIQKKYGKNAILKLKNFEEGATMRQRNQQVGGHKA
ncbi:MAG: DNA methylase, partial [Candidatus Saccharibacteria bacterium]|nr:DNA methylase [Candidatus Saccharibacteria bacterium]